MAQIPVSLLKAQVSVGDGTAGAPSISFSNDTNTGLYLAGADAVGMVTGGVERLQVNASGNVGIGTTNPASTLDVNGNVLINRNVDGRSQLYIQNTSTGTNGDNSANLILRSDAVGWEMFSFGTNASGSFSGFPRAKSVVLRSFTSAPADRMVIATGSAAPIHFCTNDTHRMTITANGSVGIGTDSPIVYGSYKSVDVDGFVKSIGVMSHRGRDGTYAGHLINFSWHDDAIFRMWVDTTHVKTFVIDHPVQQDKYLVHACLEGPENAVFYRGKSALNQDNYAIVQLPSYFTSLVDEESATVSVTPILTECTILQKTVCSASSLAVSEVKNGSFLVKAVGGINVCHQKFYWQVIATRKDVPNLIVEPMRNSVEVRGDGPYKYIHKTMI